MPNWQRSEDILVRLTTNNPTNVFSPGDKAVIFVTNKSERTIFIELISTGIEGNMELQTPEHINLKPGEAFRFPPKGEITITNKKGKDRVTVLASSKDFPVGESSTGSGIMQDRVVHSFYNLQIEDAKSVMKFDPTLIVKKTIEIETK